MMKLKTINEAVSDTIMKEQFVELYNELVEEKMIENPDQRTHTPITVASFHNARISAEMALAVLQKLQTK